RTIRKAQPNAVGGFIKADELMIQPDMLVGHGACERRMQVAAMGQEIGCAELRFRALAEDHVELDFTGAPVAVVPGARIERLAAHARFEPEPAQHLHGVATDLDAGAEPGELARLLIYGHVDADPPQRRRGRKTAHAGADDRNVERLCHLFPTPQLFSVVNPRLVMPAGIRPLSAQRAPLPTPAHRERPAPRAVAGAPSPARNHNALPRAE